MLVDVCLPSKKENFIGIFYKRGKTYFLRPGGNPVLPGPSGGFRRDWSTSLCTLITGKVICK
jgi:hypothetical protein